MKSMTVRQFSQALEALSQEERQAVLCLWRRGLVREAQVALEALQAAGQ